MRSTMPRSSSDTARRAGLIAVAGALAAALAAVGARIAARRGDGAAEQDYTCGCGARYRVTGVDRHRIYWPAGAPEDAPVLGDRCVECDAPLPTSRSADDPARAPRVGI
jgi:hypothetical protein